MEIAHDVGRGTWATDWNGCDNSGGGAWSGGLSLGHERPMTDSAPIDDDVFAEAVRKIARPNWHIWSKLIEGAQAQAALAIREREEMAAELATLKQRHQKIAAHVAALSALIEPERKP